MDEYPKVSIDEAIRRGFLVVQIPSMSVLFVSIGIVYGAMEFESIPDNGLVSLFYMAIPVFLSWLVWSFQVPRWRLWAYRRVTHLDELKMVATAKNLIWPEGSFLEKTELSTKRIRQELQQFE